MDVSIDLTVSNKLGLASHQNAVPLLRRGVITNAGAESLDDLILEFVPSLPFAVAKTWHIDRLGAGDTLELTDRDIELKEGYLSELSESIQTSADFRLRLGESAVAEQSCTIELLAPNDWGGAGSMPELLAVFCTPNDPAVDRVLKGTSEVLRRAGRPDGIDGYEAKSRQRVWELTSALWSAVCGFEISYALPPASFAESGQKIRTPSQILDGRIGTCLDTSLLFAAAAEQAGLNPIVVLTKGHALTGIWLQPQEFAQILVEDASDLRKRVELQELLVFETTLATQSHPPPFSRAIESAKQKLTDEDFVMAVDVRRARMQKLRPLSVTTRLAAVSSDNEPRVSEGLEAAPNLPGFDVEILVEPVTATAKLELWQRKLLDLTTRNRLLHLPDSAKALRLVCPDPARLEDVLADGKSVRITPMPPLAVGGRDTKVYGQRTHEDLETDVAMQALEKHEVLCKLEKPKLEATLIDLYRKARADLEEGGSNTLFLAIGFLRWKKAENDPRVYSAPLILLPVKLERKSVVSGVKMSRLDDETRFNLTLLELLRHDFHLEIHRLDGDLPEDESGVNVTAIWNIVRRAVRDMPGFEVTTDVALGTFSFAKYLMWRDLVDRSDQLEQNNVVRHLLQYKMGQSTLPQVGEFPAPDKLDAALDPRELFTPLPADSSQLAAVVASANGQNFVLDGPPGTGKSQTIANMIAHNLALGRRVLFVAEKMAALDVVKRRLDERGIGQFCLELHSSKSSKQHVLRQLDRAWTSRGRLKGDDWAAHADKVRSLRDRLNQFVEILHRRWPNGWSIFEAIGLVVHQGGSAITKLSWPEGTTHDAERMDDLRDIVRRLELNRRAAEVGGEQMALLVRTEWSNAWQEAIVGAARQAIRTYTACEEASARFVRAAGLSVAGSVASAGKLLQFARLLLDAHGADLRFAFSPELKSIQAAAQQTASLLKEYAALERGLSQPYVPEAIRRIDVDKLQGDWSVASSKFWILATLAKKKIAKALAVTAGTSAPPEVEADLPRLAAMKDHVVKIDGVAPTLRNVPGWAALDTNTIRLQLAIGLASGIQARTVALAGSPEELARLRAEVRKLVVDGNELLGPDSALALAVGELARCHESWVNAATKFAKASGSQIDIDAHSMELVSAAQAVDDNEHALKAWCDWQRVRREAVSQGLQPLVATIEGGSIAGGSVTQAFEVAYARWFAAGAIDAEPVLRHFVPAEHQSDIQAYAHAVDALSELTVVYVRAKLSGNIPDKRGVTQRSGFGILKHELQKQRRHKPVRQLAQEMGSDFAALAPCMLMSPLSIAQYLPADHELFDLVIFDEASQIAPWDAIGAIARGKQVVIAGDPRQMPPTSFFNRAAGVGDEDTDEDLESILDECLAAGIPQHSLTWHYRSRHESLIAFSNHEYYHDSLVTFPAPDTRESAVSLHRVEGVYAPGSGGRRNQVEAKAIVNEVVKRLTDPAFIRSQQTIGIITLNAEQQQLIDDLLDQARRNHPAIETFFKTDLAEPVIVKNLETMQGDERDLIMLGIGYGPTELGANTMSMNFGPLNRDGGWRRLNVAVTRARREMLVFTSFDASMINLSRTSARAVRDLRHFVEFALRGPKAIAAAVQGSMGSYESPFEEFVADGLRQKGWETHPQIGVSRFRIDLGVVNPNCPGDYLVGIECDGATYHSAATARDRDKIRAEILHGLGWQLLRVWSTEWWVNPGGALDRLDLSIRAELEAWHVRTAGAQRDSETASEGNEPESPKLEEKELFVDQISDAADPPGVDDTPYEDAASGSEALRQIARQANSLDKPSTQRVYRKVDLTPFRSVLRSADFQEPTYDATLDKLVHAVLEAEAPILDKALVDRIARVHGFKRSGRLIRNRVLALAKRRYHFQADADPEHGAFVWMSADDPLRWDVFRVPEREEDVRFIEEIPIEELAAAACIARANDVPIEVARMFRVQRLSAPARARLERAAQSLRPIRLE
ncbi:MAG TPA: DUF3320 domain-containing protein [Rhodanobacteraceae bacterium]|nr:DUF3320 domain-containing protein [Rhodanobacteraceae bacterium]